jgi:hypothetical protein
MSSTNGQSGQVQVYSAETPVLDEVLDENDLKLSIGVNLHDCTGKVASFKMERLVAEALRAENHWRLMKAVEELTTAVGEAIELKVEAKLGADAESGHEAHDVKMGEG